MNGTQLIFLLGSEGSGLYTVARALRTGGLNVGEPRPELANAGGRPASARSWAPLAVAGAAPLF